MLNCIAIYIAMSFALHMFWNPGRRSNICRSLLGLYILYAAFFGCQILGATCLGGLKEPSV